MTNAISEAAQIKIVQVIAKELRAGPQQVAAAVGLLDEGATVPFIARYRKEVTGKHARADRARGRVGAASRCPVC